MRVLLNEPLQAKNTLALESSASAYVRVASESELREALAWAERSRLAVIALGEGSNIVLAGDLDALLIQQAQGGIQILEDKAEHVVLKVAAGENWHALVEWCLSQGYSGLENLALIPGTCGAAPIQNIGAYGVELAAFVHRVSAIRVSDGQAITLSAEECEFAYRDSIFKGILRDQLIITAIELRLPKEAPAQLSYPVLSQYFEDSGLDNPGPVDVFNAVVEIRRSKLPNPLETPNAGSFFKNPVVGQQKFEDLVTRVPRLPHYPQENGLVKLSAAWLIDSCGWKGKQLGSFGVHPEHALVLVNYGGHKGQQLLDLARNISNSVASRYGVELEIEPRIYGGG